MNRTALLPALSIVALAAAAGTARADFVEQSFTYDWDSSQVQHQFSFEPFDTQGGTRELIGVRLGFEGTMALEVAAQTYGEALAAGEWFADASHVVVAYFNGGKEGLELFQPIAILGAEEITGDLGAGFPGAPFVYTDSLLVSAVVEVESAYFADFSGEGPLTGFMDGLFDGAVMPPDNEQWVELLATSLSQSGTVTLSYEYRSVPGPGGLALLGVCAALTRRRR